MHKFPSSFRCRIRLRSLEQVFRACWQLNSAVAPSERAVSLLFRTQLQRPTCHPTSRLGRGCTCVRYE
jgi:hypothetical protein